jgi:hypothetical protein
MLREITPPDVIPILQPGENEISFQAQVPPNLSPRARVTVMVLGQPIH